MQSDLMTGYIPKYSISACNLGIYGYENKTNPDAKWILGKNTSPHWKNHRIWLIKKGAGHVHTLYGDYELIEGNAYYFPGTSIIGGSCSCMEQFYLDFKTVDNTPLLNSRYILNHISRNYNAVLELLDLVFKIYTRKDEISYFTCDNAINTLLALFIKEKEDSSTLLFSKVLNYIDQHYSEMENISSKQLADIANYSQQHFVKKFKETFSVSPKKYIINKKIIKACNLLSNTNLTIRDVASECGFMDEFYFTKTFTKKIGVNPSMYRKNSLIKI